MIEKGRVDCIIRAEAYDTLEYSDKPLFTMVCTVYEAAPWPLPKPLTDQLECMINSINFHVLCK
jgi:hypothetical protein